MPEPPPESAASFERDDIELVKLFLGRYRDAAGHWYHIIQRPDTVERSAKAIEAIATNEHGERLAIEHTLVEAFEGKKADDVPFLTVFEPLRFDKTLWVPNQFIDVQCPAYGIPRGVDWKVVQDRVYSWFKNIRHEIPGEGYRSYAIPDLGFDLTVFVETMALPDTDGGVVVSRILPKDKSFHDVLRRALVKKVPKLVATPAERHILLLEDESVAIGFSPLIKGIDSVVNDLPPLKQVDEVWLVHTMGWKSEGALFFGHVWPGGLQERFKIEDSRFPNRDEGKDS